ncbi:uncharacterized protein LOC107022100 [Solanum pennellii]|uniref:Uncharacterized protein LOC107022100 n=1 Tax=Solanum pennellii TaxID=28526 RepID=A0ABM1GZS4_SOLPN|nr:uncharacterized protein LOC107022100 [Solanum pennellii]
MSGEASFSSMAPPTFGGESYQIWEVRMQAYMEYLDLWVAVEDEYIISPFPNNLTMAQIKNHQERKIRKSKAKACLFAAVSSTVFTRIISLISTKEVWDYLKAEYEGDERIIGILLGSTFNDSNIVEKILVTVPGIFKATITTLENTKDLSSITLTELLSSFQAQELLRVMRQEAVVQGSLPSKHQDDGRYKKKKNKKYQPTDGEGATRNKKDKTGSLKGNYHPCKHCGKIGHAPFKCWRRPEAKCTKCNQFGYESIIFKNKTQQHDEDARVVNEQEEDQLFVASCFSRSVSSESWLIDRGCTNHMTHDRELFKEFKPTRVENV